MISVIIPIYNTAGYLNRCINSVLSSSYEDFELILVDDGSVDQSAFICRQYCAQDPRVKYCRQDHRGVSAARNKGIEESRGTWIVFVDSDDFISPDFLGMAAYGGFQEHELLLFDFVRLKKGRIAGERRAAADKNVCRRYEEKDRMYLVRCLLNMSQLHKNGSVNLASPWAKAYKRSIIERYHIRFREDLAVYEDRLFNMEYILTAGSCTYVRRQVYYAEVRMDSAMRGYSQDFLHNDVRYQRELYFLLNCRHIFSDVEAAYYNSVLSNMTDVLVREVFHPLSTRTYKESCSRCSKMQRIKIYRRALKYNRRTGSLSRRALLFFYCRKKYCIVKLICRAGCRILEMSGRL